MAELTALTETESEALQIVRRLHRMSGREVMTAAVAFRLAPALGYDTTCKALRRLVDAGLLSKPRRGYYLPTEEAS